jgi:organic hydroperoxide reductase OsmC/OhrA
MHEYGARITWARNGAGFTDGRYSRGHEWSFDGGVTVRASSSPLTVKVPYSIAAAVDPEEALVAATASCHMLWFLSLAAQRGFVVEGYSDDAFGVMEKNAQGKLAFTRITLRPRVAFAGAALPSSEEITALHRRAHEECFIANSLNCDVVVES